MANVLDVRMKALQRQIMTVEKFLTTPSGIFETMDQMVKNFRMANKETLSALGLGKGVMPGTTMQGQVLKNLMKYRKLLRR